MVGSSHVSAPPSSAISDRPRSRVDHTPHRTHTSSPVESAPAADAAPSVATSPHRDRRAFHRSGTSLASLTSPPYGSGSSAPSEGRSRPQAAALLLGGRARPAADDGGDLGPAPPIRQSSHHVT